MEVLHLFESFLYFLYFFAAKVRKSQGVEKKFFQNFSASLIFNLQNFFI